MSDRLYPWYNGPEREQAAKTCTNCGGVFRGNHLITTMGIMCPMCVVNGQRIATDTLRCICCGYLFGGNYLETKQGPMCPMCQG